MTKEVATTENMSERFINYLVKEAQKGEGIQLTEQQRLLGMNYFVRLNQVLADAEAKRNPASNKVPYDLSKVNWLALTQNVLAYVRIGLDPMQKNHINMIPFLNERKGVYNIGFIEGYRGIELKAVKYASEMPTVTVELVYSNDKFAIQKKDARNEVETYTLEVSNPFDRGEIVGGFYYHQFDDPSKNKVVVMSMADIEKRRPARASNEFWGKWKEQMCYKTIYRAAYSDITIDSQKIDAAFMQAQQAETDAMRVDPQAEIDANANTIDIEVVTLDAETGEIIEDAPKDLDQTVAEEPDF